MIDLNNIWIFVGLFLLFIVALLAYGLKLIILTNIEPMNNSVSPWDKHKDLDARTNTKD